jgi:hypothetical protein
MRIKMSEPSQFLKAWKVLSIEVLRENKGVEVTFGVEGREPIAFTTKRFGVGRRGAKSAALAKFAAHAGYGEVDFLYNYICALPTESDGFVFHECQLSIVADEVASPQLCCVWPDEDAA